jgi:type II restriction/modification system DNA methylase subunit YeeA
LIREITSPNIIGCIVNEELVNDPQLISVIPKTQLISIEFLWAIINSKLATFYHFNSSPKATKGAFPKILVEDIKNFPLPKIDKSNQEDLTNLVDQILTLKKTNPQADTSKLEEKIDELVYKLYDLTPDEIKIVQSS